MPYFTLTVCVLVGQPPGFMYGVGPGPGFVQRGFGPQPVPGWHAPPQFASQHPAVPPAIRPLMMMPSQPPSSDPMFAHRAPVAEQSPATQPGMQFVPMQVVFLSLP